MTAIKVRPTIRKDRLVCALCQSWSGERRFNARTGYVEFDPATAKCPRPCAMKYRKSGLASACRCQGFVTWCEIG